MFSKFFQKSISRWIVDLLSVKTHRRVATGNTKSREVAGRWQALLPRTTARNPAHAEDSGECKACHLTYT